MWITGQVNLPQGVLDAHYDGKLVLFVGAGVSLSAPSNLPTFDRLASNVLQEIGIDLPAATLDRFSNRPDALLGYLCDDQNGRKGRNVHRIVSQLLADPRSKPNTNHQALVRIAATSGQFRVVTTNFDDHISTAITQLGLTAVENYYAPALPLGRDFSGLVHLHGSVKSAPDRMVLTDADFGSAYLTESWAARFLYPLFSNFTVLFIGYSHNDVVMSYLARGLPTSLNTSRYVFTDEPDEPKWRSLGITAIPYPHTADHGELSDALRAWADRAEMSALDHHRRVKELVADPPSADPADTDYLFAALTEAPAARAFAENAKSLDWVEWLASTPLIEKLLSGDPLISTSAVLASWFAKTVTQSNEGLAVAIPLLSADFTTSTILWNAIEISVGELADTDRERFNTWIPILLSLDRDKRQGREHIQLLLTKCTYPQSREALLLLWRKATTPTLTFRPAFSADGDRSGRRQPAGEVHWNFDQFWLEESWLNVVKPNLGDLAYDLIDIASNALRSAYDLTIGFQKSTAFDSISWSRSAIEPHQQDSNRRIVDVLIDCLRDSVAHVISVDPNSADAIISHWTADRRLLFQRLAIWSKGFSTTTEDEKLRYVLANRLLYKPGVKHEVFELVRLALIGASTSMSRELLDAILEDEVHAKNEDYARYNLLAWIAASAPQWTEASDAFNTLQEKHPEFKVREAPDLDSWLWVGTRTPVPLLTVDELISSTVESPERVLAKLLTSVYSNDDWTGNPTWGDALTAVSSAVVTDTRVGLSLFDAALNSPLNERVTDIVNAILSGWSRGSFSSDEIDLVLGKAQSLPGFHGFEDRLTELLLVILRLDVDLNDGALSIVRALLKRTWDECVHHIDDSRFRGNRSDWLTFGMNSWVGMLTSSWIQVVSTLVSDASDDSPVTILPNDAKEHFLRVLADDRDALGGPRACIGFELRFLVRTDEKFAVEDLYPTMSGSHGSEVSSQIWNGYLHAPRIDLRMIGLGFPTVVSASSAVVRQTQREHERQMYYQLVGLIADSLAVNNQLASQQLLIDLMSSSDTEGGSLTEFLSGLGTVLRSFDRSAAESAWSKWVRVIVEGLAEGVPVQPNLAEWTEISGWGDALECDFVEFASICRKRSASLGRSGLIGRLLSTEIPDKFPDATAGLITHLLSPEDVSVGTYRLSTLVDRIRAANANQDVLDSLTERAIAVGVPEATDWL